MTTVAAEFLTAADHAMAGRSGSAALDALGWWDLLAHLADGDARAAVFAAFRAQGRQLATSAALGGLLAHPYLERAGIAPGGAVGAIRRRSTRRGPVWAVVGDVDDRCVLFDRPGHGVSVVDADALDFHPVTVPGRLVVSEVSVDLDAHELSITDDGATDARTESLYLGRVAAAVEILGAAERAVQLATAYAIDREQFGKPIGAFQAVRHLLAWATTDCIAIEAVVQVAVTMAVSPPPRFDQVAKTLAGRNGRRACERSLQVLGGIGFTAEHVHHHHHSRVLLLDALLGSSADLSHELGHWLRTSGAEPGYAAAMQATLCG